MRSALEAAFENKICIFDVVDQLPAWQITFDRMLNDVLMYAWIWVGSHLVAEEGEKAFDAPAARKAMEMIAELADTQQGHDLLVEYLWLNAYNEIWLKAAMPRLPGRVMADVVLKEDLDYIYGGQPTVGDLIRKSANGDTRVAIAKGANELGQLLVMLKKTGWDECRKQSQGAIRDEILTYDLGL